MMVVPLRPLPKFTKNENNLYGWDLLFYSYLVLIYGRCTGRFKGGLMLNQLDNLSNTYSEIKLSIVAITSKLSPQPHFPPIIGTGFIIREDGLIFTCDHVVRAINKLPRRRGAPKDEWPAIVYIFYLVPDKGMTLIPMEIKGVFIIGGFEPKGYYYGEDIPDMGVIRVNYTGLPKLKIKSKFSLKEGDFVAVSGYPMGEGVLIAPGWLHQISPTLQTGVVSAILPFPCEKPHGFLVDIMSKGGSSGSPVFDVNTGEVHGMVYAGLKEKKLFSGKEGLMMYENSSSLTLAISNNFINSYLKKIDDTPGFKEHEIKGQKDFKSTVESAIKEGKYEIMPPKTPHLKKKVK